VKTALIGRFRGIYIIYVFIYKPCTKLHTGLLEVFIDSFCATCRCQNIAVKEGHFEGEGKKKTY